MFRIGEFSQIARVSGRLLRYYDSIGLLRPQRIDPETGYRYYSAGQLERLNRILALKELGLSLDQVARMLDDKISAAEIRGMLALKKAELERSLAEEAARLRHIESRLTQIEQQGSLGDYDVVVKSSPATPVLSTRARLSELRRGDRRLARDRHCGARARRRWRRAKTWWWSPTATSMTRISISRSASRSTARSTSRCACRPAPSWR